VVYSTVFHQEAREEHSTKKKKNFVLFVVRNGWYFGQRDGPPVLRGNSPLSGDVYGKEVMRA
jgi:hypothetical protein